MAKKKIKRLVRARPSKGFNPHFTRSNRLMVGEDNTLKMEVSIPEVDPDAWYAREGHEKDREFFTVTLYPEHHEEPAPWDPQGANKARAKFHKRRMQGWFRNTKLGPKKYLKKKMPSQQWLNLGVCQNDTRPVLTLIYQEEGVAYAANGYMLLEDHAPQGLEDGLNPSRASKKHGVDLEGRFPDPSFRKVYKTHLLYDFTVNTEALQTAVTRALVFARDSADSVRLRLSKTPVEGVTALHVLGKSAERGDCETFVLVEVHTLFPDAFLILEYEDFLGDAVSHTQKPPLFLSTLPVEVDISVNGTYLLNVLSGMRHEESVQLAGRSGGDPLWVRTHDGEREGILMSMSR